MPGTLYVVASPIGNLEDISDRALRVLRSVVVIAAEDTRRTAKLLGRYGISTPLTSFHTHSAHGELGRLLERLNGGADVALVSDAGMPCISDPGVELVAAARAAGLAVDVIPGPSALTTAMAISGISSERVMFIGFAPQNSVSRQTAFSELASWAGSVVMFESPNRVGACISDVFRCFGNRQITVARELTKVHQEVISGRASDLSRNSFPTVGEYTVVVGPLDELSIQSATPEPNLVFREFCDLTENHGFRRRDAVAELARRYRISSRAMYQLIEDSRDSVE